MPFGIKNSTATFPYLVNMKINGLENFDVYIDDGMIYNDTWEEHLTAIRRFFDQLSDAQLTINLHKIEFCKAHVQYLGHIVGQNQVKPVDVKLKAISDFPVPSCRKQLMRFMAEYYRRFFQFFLTIAEPLTNLLSKKSKFAWSDNCQQSFNKLKAILENTPIFLAPDFNKSFKLAVDVSGMELVLFFCKMMIII